MMGRYRYRYIPTSHANIWLFYVIDKTKGLGFKCTDMKQYTETNTKKDQRQNMNTAQLGKLYCFNHYLAIFLNIYGEGGGSSFKLIR